MKQAEILAQLATLGNESRKKSYLKMDENYQGFGAMLGGIRKLAKTIKADHALAWELWASENTDARVLAVMIFDPNQLSQSECEQLLRECETLQLADELVLKLIAQTRYCEAFEREWCNNSDDRIARAGWGLIVAKLMDKAENVETKFADYLASIENKLVDAQPKTQEMMNRALCEIGIRYPDYTQQCLAIGEKLGVYRDQKVAKGCTSAYAPAWIAAGIRLREPRKIEVQAVKKVTKPGRVLTPEVEAFLAVKTLDQYLALMSPLRQAKIMVVVEYIYANYPEVEFGMYYGPQMSFPMLMIGEKSISFASQKQYLSIYFSKWKAVDGIVEANPKLKRQKSCLNVRDSVEIPIQALYEAIDMIFGEQPSSTAMTKSEVVVVDSEVNEDIATYIAQQSELRQSRMHEIIGYITTAYPHVQVTMEYGAKTKFPTYKIDGVYVTIASMKHHLTIHFGKYGATKIVAKANPKIKAHVGCVNIPDTIDLPIQAIQAAIKHTYED